MNDVNFYGKPSVYSCGGVRECDACSLFVMTIEAPHVNIQVQTWHFQLYENEMKIRHPCYTYMYIYIWANPS